MKNIRILFQRLFVSAFCLIATLCVSNNATAATYNWFRFTQWNLEGGKWPAGAYVPEFYDVNGGQAYKTKTVSSGIAADTDKPVNMPSPTRKGYTFNTWQWVDPTHIEIDPNEYDHTVLEPRTCAVGARFFGKGDKGNACCIIMQKQIIGTSLYVWTSCPTSFVVRSIEMHALWTPIKYNITYELNSGTNNSANPATYTIENKVTLKNPTRSGYVFGGWYSDSNFSGSAIESIPYGSTGDKTFHAKWTQAKCNITHGTGTATVSNNKVTCEVTCDSGYSKTGYTDTTESFTTDASSDATVSASCYARTYKVILDSNFYTNVNDTTGVPAKTPGTQNIWYQFETYKKDTDKTCPITPGCRNAPADGLAQNCYYWKTNISFAADKIWDNCVKRNAIDDGGTRDCYPYIAIDNIPTYTGYEFGGYFSDKTGTGTKYTNKYGTFVGGANALYKTLPASGTTRTVYAKWTPLTYNVTYSCGTGTGQVPSSTTATYDASFTTAANTCAKNGYSFDGWMVSGTTADVKSANTNFTWKYTENKTLTAKWKYKIYYVKNGGNGWNKSDNDISSGVSQTTRQANEAQIGTKNHYSFSGWCIDDNKCPVASQINAGDQICDTESCAIGNIKLATPRSNGYVYLYANWTPIRYVVLLDDNLPAGHTGQKGPAGFWFDWQENQVGLCLELGNLYHGLDENKEPITSSDDPNYHFGIQQNCNAGETPTMLVGGTAGADLPTNTGPDDEIYVFKGYYLDRNDPDSYAPINSDGEIVINPIFHETTDEAPSSNPVTLYAHWEACLPYNYETTWNFASKNIDSVSVTAVEHHCKYEIICKPGFYTTDPTVYVGVRGEAAVANDFPTCVSVQCPSNYPGAESNISDPADCYASMGFYPGADANFTPNAETYDLSQSFSSASSNAKLWNRYKRDNLWFTWLNDTDETKNLNANLLGNDKPIKPGHVFNGWKWQYEDVTVNECENVDLEPETNCAGTDIDCHNRGCLLGNSLECPNVFEFVGGVCVPSSKLHSVASETSILSQSQRNFYAQYSLGSDTALYEITLDKNGGTGGDDVVYELYGIGYYKNQYTTDAMINSISVPTRDNYTFDGYYTSADKQIFISTGAFAAGVDAEEFTANTTLYAKWTYFCTDGLVANNDNNGCICADENASLNDGVCVCNAGFKVNETSGICEWGCVGEFTWYDEIRNMCYRKDDSAIPCECNVVGASSCSFVDGVKKAKCKIYPDDSVECEACAVQSVECGAGYVNGSGNTCDLQQYSIAYELDGGVCKDSTNTEISCGRTTYTINDEEFDLLSPTKSGWVFYQWCDEDNNCSNLMTFVPDVDNLKNKTFYAKWLQACPSDYPYPLEGVESLSDCYQIVEQVCPCNVENASTCSFAGGLEPKTCMLHYGQTVCDLSEYEDPSECAVTDVGCRAGYFAQTYDMCTICDEGYYCPGGTEPKTKCVGNLMSPAGSRKEGDCGQILHVGNGQMYVHLDRPDVSKPALAIRIDSTTYYANLGTDSDVMTLDSDKKLHIKTSTKNYTAFDNSVLYNKPSE